MIYQSTFAPSLINLILEIAKFAVQFNDLSRFYWDSQLFLGTLIRGKNVDALRSTFVHNVS